MKIARTERELRAALAPERAAGRTIGFVPTMGALHEGHLSLMRTARAATDVLVVSIFVNPLQFGPSEDLDTYPRDEQGDLDQCAAEGVDVVFLPDAAEMYPRDASTRVTVGPLARVVEGEHRPGHFDGVATVVAKLFGLVEPDTSVFGQKDAQQVAVIKRLVADLSLDVELVVCPTVREADGLAVSSRNAGLDADARASATALWEALCAGRAAVLTGADIQTVEKTMWEELTSRPGVEPDYARVVDPDSFSEPSEDGRKLLAVAARVGGIRLIDNELVTR